MLRKTLEVADSSFLPSSFSVAVSSVSVDVSSSVLVSVEVSVAVSASAVESDVDASAAASASSSTSGSGSGSGSGSTGNSTVASALLNVTTPLLSREKLKCTLGTPKPFATVSCANSEIPVILNTPNKGGTSLS